MQNAPEKIVASFCLLLCLASRTAPGTFCVLASGFNTSKRLQSNTRGLYNVRQTVLRAALTNNCVRSGLLMPSNVDQAHMFQCLR